MTENPEERHPFGRYEKELDARFDKLAERIEKYVGNYIIDHASMVIKENTMEGLSQPVRKLALQPYSVRMVQLEKLIEFCKVNGLTFHIDTGSIHNPNGCLMILIEEVKL